MGLLTDIYVSRDDEEAIGYDSKPSAFADRVQSGRLTSGEFATLWALLRNVEWDVSMVDEFLFLPLPDDHDTYISRVPTAMTEALARLTPEQISVAATKWAATEELKLANWTPGDAQSFMDDLVRLAQTASATGRNIYLWNCL